MSRGDQISLPGLPGKFCTAPHSLSPTSDAATLGTQIHSILGLIASGKEVDLDIQPVEFAPAILQDLPTLGFRHEIPVERPFEVDGTARILRGSLDALAPDGTAWEYKTTDSWCGVDRAITHSYQWRCYLWAESELVQINYCVFRVDRRGDRPKVVEMSPPIAKFPHPSLAADVQFRLEQLVRWINRHAQSYWNTLGTVEDAATKCRDIEPTANQAD